MDSGKWMHGVLRTMLVAAAGLASLVLAPSVRAEGGLTLEERLERLERKGEAPAGCCDTSELQRRLDQIEAHIKNLPFGLKLYESLLESVPTHGPLLLATCRGFTQYAYAFIEADADALDASKREEASALRDRALKLYLRARDYCLRAIDVRFGAGTRTALLQNPATALARATRADVELLYWTAASWGAAAIPGIPASTAGSSPALSSRCSWTTSPACSPARARTSAPIPSATIGAASSKERGIRDGAGRPLRVSRRARGRKRATTFDSSRTVS